MTELKRKEFERLVTRLKLGVLLECTLEQFGIFDTEINQYSSLIAESFIRELVDEKLIKARFIEEWDKSVECPF